MKIFTTILLFFFISFNFAFAGNVILYSENNRNIKVGDEVLIDIKLETEDIFYNTIKGVLSVDKNLEIKRIIIGNSIVSAWIENPNKTKNNVIEFSGIIAGGFKGSGLIFSLVVVPKNPVNSVIVMDDLSIFINDGNGTEELLSKKKIYIHPRLLDFNEENSKIEFVDTKAPLPFEVFILKDENIENGNYILVFEAKDKESGVKTYNVTEGKEIYKDVRSPYLLKNQQINEIIRVTAIDYKNNERVINVTIPKTVCFGIKCVKQYKVTFILIFILITSSILWKKYSKKIKKSLVK